MLKFFHIKFEDNFKQIYNNISLNLPNVIWDKLFKFVDCFNYKIGIFAVFLIQTVSPREYIDNLVNFKINDNKSINNDLVTIIPRESNYWMNENEIENLFVFIRDKVIFDIKIKNTVEKDNFPSIVTNYEKSDKIENLKIDEIMDQNDLKESELFESGKLQDFQMRKDENISLEELGVFEVEDEIFENFDEDNIPVIKNIYKRKKGSAEKLKTNQTTRNLLMSNLNKQSKDENINYDNMHFDQSIPETQIRKSIFLINLGNIRPQNGLRPATPPLKQTHKKFNQDTQIKEKEDKKYEINSMEELFLNDEEKKDVINQEDIILSDEKDYNDELILNSFENLNLEDFKNPNFNSFKGKISELEHINEYIIKTNEYPDNIKIEDYNYECEENDDIEIDDISDDNRIIENNFIKRKDFEEEKLFYNDNFLKDVEDDLIDDCDHNV